MSKNKSGYVMDVIGRQEAGKSPFIKSLYRQSLYYKYKRSCVLDIENEYDHNEHTIFTDLDLFKKHLETAKAQFIIIEEATTFVASFKDFDLQKLCVKIAHNNNVCIFVFHTLMDAPKSLLNKSRYIALFDTLDDEKDIKSQRNRYYNFFMMKNKPVIIDNYNLCVIT